MGVSQWATIDAAKCRAVLSTIGNTVDATYSYAKFSAIITAKPSTFDATV
jgi:hypothetical protein